MLEHPQLEVAEPVVALLRLEEVAELRLSAGSLDEHHQLARHGERRGLTPVLLDHRERHVHPGRHSCGRVDAATLDIERVGLDAGARGVARQPIAVAPVCGRRAPVQETGAGQYQRAGADRADAGHDFRASPQPRKELGVGERRLVADATRHQERVDAAKLAVGARGDEPQPARGLERSAPRGDEFHRVGRHAPTGVILEPPAGAGKDLERARDVEDLCVGVREHRNTMRTLSPAAQAGSRSRSPHRRSLVAGSRSSVSAPPTPRATRLAENDA